PFCPWVDRLTDARLLHLFGMSREGLELARVARARGVPVVLSPICWLDPRALAALAPGPAAAAFDLARWAVRRAGPPIPDRRHPPAGFRRWRTTTPYSRRRMPRRGSWRCRAGSRRPAWPRWRGRWRAGRWSSPLTDARRSTSATWPCTSGPDALRSWPRPYPG